MQQSVQIGRRVEAILRAQLRNGSTASHASLIDAARAKTVDDRRRIAPTDETGSPTALMAAHSIATMQDENRRNRAGVRRSPQLHCRTAVASAYRLGAEGKRLIVCCADRMPSDSSENSNRAERTMADHPQNILSRPPFIQQIPNH